MLKSVRVVKEVDEHATNYGITGTCTGVDEILHQVTITGDREAVTAPMDAVEVKTLRQCKNAEFMSFTRVSEAKKRCMVFEVAGWDPLASIPLSPVTLSKPKRLEDEHLRLWNVVLRATFPKANFLLFDPSVYLHRLFLAFDKETALQEGIRQAFTKKDLLLFPLQCPESKEHNLGHWTLLAIDPKGQVRYYESMNEVNDICLHRASQILSILGLPQEKLVRINNFRQKSDECTEVVMHYAEIEVRHLAGEGWGATKGLHPHHRVTMRKTLGRFSSNLEATRKDWLLSCEKEDIQKKLLKLHIEQKVGKAAGAQLELAKLRALSDTVAKVMQEYDKNLPRLDLPAQEKTKAKAKAQEESGDASTIEIWSAAPLEGDVAVEVAAAEGDDGDLQGPPEEAAPEVAAPAAAAAAPEEVAAEAAAAPAAAPAAAAAAAAANQELLESLGLQEDSDELLSKIVPLSPKKQVETPAPTSADEVAALESQIAEAGESTSAEVGAIELDGELPEAEVVDVAQADCDLNAETQEVLAELGKHEAKFESWVNIVSPEQKGQIIEWHYKDHDSLREFKRYIKYVTEHETVGGCSKCRWSYKGCVKCTTRGAQNYIMRHGQLPAWWRSFKDHLLRCAGYIYIYIYHCFLNGFTLRDFRMIRLHIKRF